jgi:hypothetical protein
VGLDRLELSTSPLSGVRSNHLSYKPSPTYLMAGPVPAGLARRHGLSFAKKEKRRRQRPLRYARRQE